MKRWLSITVALFAVTYMFVYMIAESAADDKRGTTSRTGQSLGNTTTINAGNLRVASPGSSGDQVSALKALAAQSPNFNVERFSINSGGDIMVSSASFGSGVSVAQSAAGKATSASYRMGIGFWYALGGSCCNTPGDASGDDKTNIADVTYLIAWLFAGGADPACCAQGSANGDDKINIADVTYIIAWLFTGGADPICGPVGMGC